MKIVKATSWSEATGRPSQIPARCLVPWIVRAVVPGSSWSPAWAWAVAHVPGVVTASMASHCRV